MFRGLITLVQPEDGSAVQPLCANLYAAEGQEDEAAPSSALSLAPGAVSSKAVSQGEFIHLLQDDD